MGERKHTPGPWNLNRHGAIVGGEFHEYTNGSAQSQVAMAVGGNGISDEERKANGHLIATAPELLEALAKLADLCDGFNVSGVYFNMQPDCRAALFEVYGVISKAIGSQS